MFDKLGIKGRRTPQRRAILEYLEGNTAHPSADDIFAHVIARFPNISRATVYNTMDSLKAQGKVMELHIDSERRRFDPDMSPHHHLICTRCGMIRDIHIAKVIDVPDTELDGFTVQDARMEFFGTCDACRSGRSKALICVKCGGKSRGAVSNRKCQSCGGRLRKKGN